MGTRREEEEPVTAAAQGKVKERVVVVEAEREGAEASRAADAGWWR